MKVIVYRAGLASCSVCAPADLSMEEVETEVNAANPTGIDHKWKRSKDPTFKTGETNPCPCETDSRRVHYLMSC